MLLLLLQLVLHADPKRNKTVHVLMRHLRRVVRYLAIIMWYACVALDLPDRLGSSSGRVTLALMD